MSSRTLDGNTMSLVGSRRRLGAQRSTLLRVVYPAEVVTVIDLDAPRVVIGRDPESGGTLRHATVSRQHFAFEWDSSEGAHVGSDLGSRNGSWIDGQRVGSERVKLADGAVIRLGDVLGVYECITEPPVEIASGVSHDAIPGESAAAWRLRSQVARAAADPSPVLIIGETGTGKELVAAELHRLSGRTGECVALNCAALAPQLIESQLFGHERGAFTGAMTAQPGLFRAAAVGTLFLDEIGDMPIELQPKLLRAIQSGEVLPVGATRHVAVDVRVIAATNRDLAADIDTGRFRRDLYARLALWEIRVPPLRERRADLFGWIGRLYSAWAAGRPGRHSPGIRIEPDAAEALLVHSWPENLRGLDRLVHELAAHDSGEAIALADLPCWLNRPTSATPRTRPAQPEAARAPTSDPRPPTPGREELAAALAQNGWSVRATAKQFGRDRRQIYRWMDSYGIRKP